MNVGWFCAYIWPNAFVLFFTCILGVVNLTYGIPKVVSLGHIPPVFAISVLVWAISFCMFIWCWLRAGLADPGRIEDDLRERGLLSRVLRGDIPQCLRSLPICRECHLPFPPTAYHCKICGKCVLRYDHHCAVVGACIGDKNFKAFILSFFYIALYGLSNAFCNFLWFSTHSLAVPELFGAMSGFISAIMSVVLMISGCSFFYDAGDAKTPRISRLAQCRKLLRSFGRTWPERLIPLQRQTTFLAWPGVSFDDEIFLA
jgi:hypothetical protein